MLFSMQCWKREKAVAGFFIDSWFIQLILWFCYNAWVNSHSQLLAVWKVTDTKMSCCKHIEQGHIRVKKTSAATCLFGHVIEQWNHLIYIMVVELSGVQFGLKSYAWFQNRTSTQCEFDLKSQVWFQTKLHSKFKSLTL